MNAGMINKNTPMGESQMQQQIKRYGVSLLKQQFPDDFNVDNVFGAVDLPRDEIQGWTGSQPSPPATTAPSPTVSNSQPLSNPDNQ